MTRSSLHRFGTNLVTVLLGPVPPSCPPSRLILSVEALVLGAQVLQVPHVAARAREGQLVDVAAQVEALRPAKGAYERGEKEEIK